MASLRRVRWRMCERQKENCFAKCKTKCEVIDVYMSRLESLQNVAQQNYAIDSQEFQAYVRWKIGGDYVLRSRQHHRGRCDVNDTGLFSRSSLKNFAKFVTQCVRNQLRRYFVYIIICAVVIVLVNYKTETSNAFMQNIQTFIYPVMRAWRKMTLPLIQTFPTLTDVYDETCLIENPLFRVTNLDCTPCIGIVKVVEYSTSYPTKYLDHSVPHIVQVNSTIRSKSSGPSPIPTESLIYFSRLHRRMPLRFPHCFRFTLKIVKFFGRVRIVCVQLMMAFVIWINCLTIF